MPGRVRTNPRVRRSLITYLGAAGLVLLIVAFGAVLVGRQVAEDEALRDAERLAQRTAELVVGPLLGDILNGDLSRRPELDRAVANRLRDGTIVELVVWERSGTIIYADEADDIGERLPVSEEVLAAIDRGVVTSDITEKPETGSFPGGTRLVEVYAPLRLPGQPPLAFEIYLPYDRVESTATGLVMRIVPLTVGALLLLQLIQTPITVSLARRVARHEAERTALLERALSASDRERRQIAADLHDGVVQDLAGAGYALAALQRRVDAAGAKSVEQVGRVVRGAVESLRRLMVDIYPPDLSGAGLPGALDDLAEPLRHAGVTVHVRAQPLSEADSAAAATVYRIARETLTNIVKHARATTVDIELGPDPAAPGQFALLQVTDDGVGIRPEQLDKRAAGHLGVRLLIDRVADQGGELRIEPGPQGGTVALARMPVANGYGASRPAGARTPPAPPAPTGTRPGGTGPAEPTSDRAPADSTS
jgi:two-component system NarL family sensor kinase